VLREVGERADDDEALGPGEAVERRAEMLAQRCCGRRRKPTSQGVFSSPDVVLTVTASPLCFASMKPVEKRTSACGKAFSFS